MFSPFDKRIFIIFDKRFPSLNAEIAVDEGGGRNFVIYNFQTSFISEIIGFSRNCGPFWEPGMFAFLSICPFSWNYLFNHIAGES